MTPLKGGQVADFADSMAAAIEKAMDEEWHALKGEALPDAGQDYRRLLLAAVARGVLTYLKAHEDELFSDITIDDGVGPAVRPVTHVGFNYLGT